MKRMAASCLLLLGLTLGSLASIGLAPSVVFARSGCCSHHGGVCGCGCCDGSGLSATCAPYYPWCNDAPSYAPTPQIRRCPANSTLAGDTCYCNSGYSAFSNSCIKIPINAHEANNGQDAWLCDAGYIEKGNGCILKPIPVISSSSSSSASSVSVSSSSEANEISLPDLPKTQPPQEKKGFWSRFMYLFFGS